MADAAGNSKPLSYMTGLSQDFIDLADVLLVVDDGSLPVHTHVLALHSKVGLRYLSLLCEHCGDLRWPAAVSHPGCSM